MPLPCFPHGTRLSVYILFLPGAFVLPEKLLPLYDIFSPTKTLLAG